MSRLRWTFVWVRETVIARGQGARGSERTGNAYAVCRSLVVTVLSNGRPYSPVFGVTRRRLFNSDRSTLNATTKWLVFKRLFFGDFLLARQKKVTRQAGRDPRAASSNNEPPSGRLPKSKQPRKRPRLAQAAEMFSGVNGIFLTRLPVPA